VESEQGTYILMLELSRPVSLKVGRLGEVGFKPGWYLYVGSAFGPGGVGARCGHHRRISANPRWHIDYLRAVSRLPEIWYTHDPEHREHQWAELLSRTRGASQPVTGFGASDCRCESHLFHFQSKPDWRIFQRRARKQIDAQNVIFCEFS
jgi:Uri superfamily endonuclease